MFADGGHDAAGSYNEDVLEAFDLVLAMGNLFNIKVCCLVLASHSKSLVLPAKASSTC